MADKRITDFTEAASAGADYYLVTDSASDGVKKIKPANIVPAFTGDVTKDAGGTVTTIANNAVTNTKAAQMAAGTIKSNLTGALASASDNTINAVMDAAFGATQGAVAYRGASGWSSLAPGVSGQFMQTSGPAANPIWQTIPGGGNMLSSTYDPTGQSTDAFSYTASGTGAVTRRIKDKLGEVVSLKDFPASGSTQSTTGTTTAASASITLASAIDFKNGQGIRVNHAGAAFACNPPTSLTVTPTGTAGATTYTYQIASLDAHGGVGAAITAVATTTGNATLDEHNYNALAWTAPVSGPAPAGYAIYGRVAGSLTLIGMTNDTSFKDIGTGFSALGWLPSTPQATALADWLLTTIVSGAGTTTLTLANAATGAVAGAAVWHDDTAAIQAAINAAQTYTGKLHITRGTYPFTATLSQTSKLVIDGDGKTNAVLLATDLAPGVDAWLASVSPPGVASDSQGWSWQNFGIYANSADIGRYGLRIYLASGANLQNFTIEKASFGGDSRFALQGLFLDNSVQNLDGFFVATVRRNTISNGYYGNYVGDSVNVECNQVTNGPNTAIVVQGVSGARQYIFRENNLTTRGGAFALTGCGQARLINNQCEHGWWQDNGHYTGVYGAHIYVANSPGAKIIGNTINPFPNYVYNSVNRNPYPAGSSITVDGTSTNVLIDANDICIGGLAHLSLGTSAMVRYGESNTIYSSPAQTFSWSAPTAGSLKFVGNQARFSAHKNGTTQTINAAAGTKLTFGTAPTNIRGSFDTTNSRFTPDKGPVKLSASYRVTTGAVAGDVATLSIYKNGALFRDSPAIPFALATYFGASIDILDEASGSDYYEIFAFCGGGAGGTRDISGDSTLTWFMGANVD